MSPSARPARRAGELAAGTVDSFLDLAPDHGPAVCDRCHQRVPDAAHGPPDASAGPTTSANYSESRRKYCPKSARARGNSARPWAWISSRTGIPIMGVAGDQQASLIGQGCVAPGQAKCTFGTGAFLLAHTGGRVVPSRRGLITTLAATLDDISPAVRPGRERLRRRGRRSVVPRRTQGHRGIARHQPARRSNRTPTTKSSSCRP